MKGAKVLVTGADGFIGSHLVEQLLEEGAAVRAMALYHPRGDFGWLAALPQHPNLEIFQGDVRDAGLVKKVIANCDYAFHLAALIGIPYSYQAPQSYLDTNTQGTLNLLEAALAAGTKRLIITSTSEVYGNALYFPMDEEHPQHPASPYAASKQAADSMALAYHKSFDLPISVVRPFNTFGPRQSARAIIPTIVSQLLYGEETISLGDLRPKRDFVYVKDTVTAFLAIALSDACLGKTLNVASGKAITMDALAAMLIAAINPKAIITADPERLRPANSEVQHLQGDASLLHELTHWKPHYGLQEGLQETINWFRQQSGDTAYNARRYYV